MIPKFIQICTDVEGDLYALDSDGHVWELVRTDKCVPPSPIDFWQRLSGTRK